MWCFISCCGTYSRRVPISNCNEKFGGHLSNYDRSVLSGLGVSLTLYHVNGAIKTRCVFFFHSIQCMKLFQNKFNSFLGRVNFVGISFEA